ncbi:4Fe-4S dicluster domain-containing protein [Thermodesulfobacteriota bacterium]
MKKVSLIFLKKDCMGCHTCEVACKQEHGLGVGPRLVRVLERGPDFMPVYCHHCANAPCKEACPENAITRDARGVVLISSEACIGCKECLEACPFGAMQYDDEQETAVKCDLCFERLELGEAPACSKVCPTQCIYWGDTKAFFTRLDEGR